MAFAVALTLGCGSGANGGSAAPKTAKVSSAVVAGATATQTACAGVQT